MNLSKKAIGLIILLTSTALVGLAIMQITWLNKSIDANRQVFQQKVDLVATAISERFQREDIATLKLRTAMAYNQEMTALPSFDGILRSIIDTVMMHYNLPLNYQYGIYNHKDNKSGQFVFVSGDAPAEEEIMACLDSETRKFGWASLACGTHFGNQLAQHLAIYPDEKGYLFAQIQNNLFASGAFIIILIGCFAFTIITINRQKKASEIKNDFINNLTHEFKTPIFSINLASSILKGSKELKDSDKLLKYIDIIDSESDRLKGHVDKVLQMALVDSGNFKLEKKNVDIHEVIRKVVNNFDLLIKQRKGNLKLKLNAHNTNMFIDETHVNNVINNLLDNALKYTPGSPEIMISTEDAQNDQLILSIRDNGIGMSAEVQKYIFTKFYRAQTGDVHNIKGFGLGLSYVKRIVEEHRGKINIVSSPELGSEFVLQLPKHEI